jgi:ATP-dependent DNA helicase 2 subunit 1
VPKRALFSNLPLELGPGLRISVKGYIIFKRQEIHKTCYVYLKGEKPVLAKSASSKLEDDDGKTVEKNRVLKAYKFGGTRITFSQDEAASLRNFGEPIIRLLGFKAITSQNLPLWANTNRSTFLYPSEEDYIGSTRVFAALHAKLLSAHKMAVAWFVARKNATPVLAAILPGAEQLNEAGEQEVPPGLWLVPLPFVDDVRAVPEHAQVPASEALTEKMRTVVQQLQLPGGKYVPSRYPNPSLQWHYRVLQAMALEEDMPTQAEDKTAPRNRQIHKRAGPYVVEWGEQLEEEHRAWEQTEGRAAAAALPKRPASSAAGPGGSPEKKRVKTEDGGPAEEDMRAAWKQERIGKFTVAELKAFAASKGIDAGGKKAELVDQIEAWFESR